MKKKIVTMILAATLTFSLSGCGVSQYDFDSVVAEKEAAEADLASANNSLSQLQADFDALQSDYDTLLSDFDAYRDLMKPYEELAVSETDDGIDVSYSEFADNDSFDNEDISNISDDVTMQLASYGVVFKGAVNNDVTGNWRYATYDSNISQEAIAIDYCNTYFKSDKELHALINKSDNTVACIQYIFSDLLDVTIHEYTKGEELDAKELFGGDVITEYFVTISTGEIEEATDE